MHLQISASGMDLSESTKVYIDEKIGRLSKLLAPNQDEAAKADVHLIYAQHNTKATKDKVHVTMTGVGGGQVLHVETEEPDMLVAIDRASQKLEEQLRRLKEKLRDHLHKGAAESKYVAPEQTMETGPLDPTGGSAEEE